jgi:hypothetical protein
VSKIRNQTTDKIKQQKMKMPQTILYVVSEDVKVEHVAAYVKNVGVKEQGCEEGVKVFSSDYFGWNHGKTVVNPVCEYTYARVFREKDVEQQRDKSKNIHQYKNPRYVRSGFGTIRVPNRNQKFSSNPR